MRESGGEIVGCWKGPNRRERKDEMFEIEDWLMTVMRRERVEEVDQMKGWCLEKAVVNEIG